MANQLLSLETLPKLPIISKTAHKHTRGHALIVAGSLEKSGAAILSSLAAMRSGVGLCTLALPSKAHDVIKSQLINVMSEVIPSDEKSVFLKQGLAVLISLLEKKHALLIGPGLAPDEDRKFWIHTLLQSTHIPMVIDAQALTDLGEKFGSIDFSKSNVVITPHAGEMSRLTKLSVEEIEAHREQVAQKYAKLWNVTILLKGSHTLIAHGDEIWTNQVDHECLSVAGTGDILAGILVSLLAQKISIFDAAKLAVYIHGRAGQRLGERVGVRGVLATDLFNEIPQVIHEIDTNQTT